MKTLAEGGGHVGMIYEGGTWSHVLFRKHGPWHFPLRWAPALLAFFVPGTHWAFPSLHCFALIFAFFCPELPAADLSLHSGVIWCCFLKVTFHPRMGLAFTFPTALFLSDGTSFIHSFTLLLCGPRSSHSSPPSPPHTRTEQTPESGHLVCLPTTATPLLGEPCPGGRQTSNIK